MKTFLTYMGLRTLYEMFKSPSKFIEALPVLALYAAGFGIIYLIYRRCKGPDNE